ncbi:two-component sensor histidine kinase AdeS [Acinetobacter sp. ANC 4177]|uniref:two-component sensor histidine kinase AdeS n=1 Tax=Acinetobacter sp. ANC 4177 TaxID=2529838 RepID=UPI00104079E3|nr:two-component sensor histidine kinase AdeS [Acinetobacter sp. ANC 4177]TCB72987.1 two-component sensor histidine kinase AdeS [Acinetobacter sp. ANC 4177]
MKFNFLKNSVGINFQFIIMMSLLNLGVTFLSFALGYLVYSWAIEIGFLDFQSVNSNEFSITSVDFIWFFLVLLTGFFLSTFLAYRYGKRYTQPISALANVIQQIQQGNLSLRIEELHHDIPHELRSLIQNFNAMANQLEVSVKNSTIWNAAIAHELRTPVTILQGRLQGIVDGVFIADQKLHQSLLNQVEGLSYLVEDLRTLTLIENKQFRLELQKTNLKASIYKCLQMFHERFQAKGLNEVVNLTDECVLCDERRMEQVFIAFFSNVLRYANPGQLKITTYKTQENWILMLEDEGPGIDESHLEYLFKPFYRLEDSRSRLDGGTGLGLAVIDAIIEAHQGRINYSKSKNLGGSCFTIQLNLKTLTHL